MTEIRVGQTYVAKRIYTGRNDTGPYEIIVVQAPGRKQPKIGISPIKVPSRIGPNSVFKITSIKSVQNRSWRNPKTGVWQTGGQITVRAGVKALGSLSPEEMEEVVYKETVPEYPSLEDWFNDK